MSREQNTRRRLQRRAEVTQEERIQDWKINAAHQTVSKKRLQLRFVGTAIGELEVFKKKSNFKYRHWKKYASFSKLWKGKVKR